ncbi:MAG: hypothetical protein ACOCYW_07540 [Roseicyclus sp.]
MILVALGLGAVGLWFLIAGDAPARIIGLLMIALALGLFWLFWIGLTAERPVPGSPPYTGPEARDG